MNKKLTPVLLAATALVAGCDQWGQKTAGTASPSPVVNKEDAVAVVNGHYISQASLQALEQEVAKRAHGQTFPKEKLIEELVRRELLVEDALSKHLDTSPAMIVKIEDAKRALLTQADLQDYLESHPVTDEELQALYEKKFGGENAQEYKARHILVKTEDEAKKLIDDLNNGGNFEELAKQHSTGPSGPKGGDLGWFIASQMVAPFSEAVIALKNGEYTTEPVQTQFGWHVILREDSREQSVPPLAAVKSQLLPYLQRQKIQDFLEGLRSNAQVEILTPAAEATPAPETEEKPEADTTASAAPAENTETKPAAASGDTEPQPESAPAEEPAGSQ